MSWGGVCLCSIPEDGLPGGGSSPLVPVATVVPLLLILPLLVAMLNTGEAREDEV